MRVGTMEDVGDAVRGVRCRVGLVLIDGECVAVPVKLFVCGTGASVVIFGGEVSQTDFCDSCHLGAQLLPRTREPAI